MAFKGVLFVCAQALLAQCVFGQIGYNVLSNGSPLSSASSSIYESNVIVNSGASVLGNAGLGASGVNIGSIGSNLANTGVLNSINQDFINLGAISGGGVLSVSSYSPIAPGGLRVVSDNVIEGNVLVSGELPFLSAVAFEGGLATGGSGAASCGCGDGLIGIVSESSGAGLGLGGLGSGLGGGLGGVRGYGRGLVL